MEPAKITALAHKIQLIIGKGEMVNCLETFMELERQLASFKKLKISPKVKPMTRINTGYLTLRDLKKLAKKYTNQRVNEETLRANAEITSDHFVFFKIPPRT